MRSPPEESGNLFETIRPWLAGLLVLGGLAGAGWMMARWFGPLRVDPHNPPIHTFAEVTGPAHDTAPPLPPPAADPQDYAAGSESRLALLLTDEKSDWLGLAHGLKSHGVPFRVTRDVASALRHNVVLAYPTISGRVLSAEALRALARHPERGGTLIACGIEGGGLEEVFGFSGAEVSRAHRRLRLDPPGRELAAAADPAEFEVPVNSLDPDSAIALVSFTPTRAGVVARYEDGRAAVLHRAIGDGHAYALGLDLGFLLLKGYNDRQEKIARSYANGFEPALDVLLRLVRGAYERGEPAALSLHPVPEGRPLAVVLSHDIDYTRSIEHALDYLALERSQGVPATYFIQTKYVRDWNDDIFFNDRAREILPQLRDGGMELASHSVAHARIFSTFPAGTGRERYPDYRPFVQKRREVVNGTILGELRVSKFLLERFAPGAEVLSFRPGHLENPRALPQLLTATGYRYSSSTTANNALTHLPFRLTHDRDKSAAAAVFEFPVTIEDEAQPPLPERLDAALALAGQIARHGGLFMVLIHTDTTGAKLEFQRRLTQALQERGSWFGRLRDYGAWWSARDGVEMDARRRGDRLEIQLHAPQPISGLALRLPGGKWRAAAAPAGARIEGSLLRLAVFSGDLTVRLEREPD